MPSLANTLSFNPHPNQKVEVGALLAGYGDFFLIAVIHSKTIWPGPGPEALGDAVIWVIDASIIASNGKVNRYSLYEDLIYDREYRRIA